RSSRRINRESTGKSGSPPWRHLPNTRGPCISSGNFCTTIPARSLFWPTIHSPTRHLITFGHAFIVTSLLHWATKHGGNANQSVTGCPSFPRMTPSSAVCSERCTGWIDGTHEEACPGDQCECSGTYRGASVKVSS